MQKQIELAGATDPDDREQAAKDLAKLQAQLAWLEQTIVQFIISESQNEVKAFKEWKINIRPHRDLMKKGFETPDGRLIQVDTPFKDPAHAFRVAIVCAMWLTGFDVESLSTLYLDKPMKAQQLVASLLEAIEAAEAHLRSLGFEPNRLIGARGFDRIEAFRDAVEALNTSEEARRRFHVVTGEVVSCFDALVMEPSVFQHVERRDNLETISKKLEERLDFADVTQLLKELHRIVNAAVGTQGRGADQADGLTVNLSK